VTESAGINRHIVTAAFKTGIPGFNGDYHSTPTGYNRVPGNGTINGTNFMLAPTVPVAGTPQTPPNPGHCDKLTAPLEPGNRV
jgi:hypothetical protein